MSPPPPNAALRRKYYSRNICRILLCGSEVYFGASGGRGALYQVRSASEGACGAAVLGCSSPPLWFGGSAAGTAFASATASSARLFTPHCGGQGASVGGVNGQAVEVAGICNCCCLYCSAIHASRHGGGGRPWAGGAPALWARTTHTMPLVWIRQLVVVGRRGRANHISF